MEFRAILFDMGGVLVDSREAWFRAVRSQEPELTQEAFDRDWWSRDQHDNMERLGTTAARFCREVLADHLDQVREIDRVEEVLDAIDLPKALITNTSRGCTRQILDRFGLGSRFRAVVTSDDVEHGKPDADLVQVACRALGVAPEEAVVVGDSPEDVRAGRRAGCFTIGVGIDGDGRVEELAELPALVLRLACDRE